MKINGIQFDHVRFPGRAGELQAAGATGALVRELGGNYRRYHDFLADALARAGGRPAPEDYESFAAYAEAWDVVQEIGWAEAVLRACRGYIVEGRPLSGAAPVEEPLIDEKDRLIAAD